MAPRGIRACLGRAGLGALLVLLPALARAEVQGRAELAVRSGGGYASDLFLGAGLDPTASASLAPVAALDLSFMPQLKLFTLGEAELEHYFATGGTAYAASGEALLQYRPNNWLYPELYARVQGNWYHDLLGPVDPTVSGAPSVTWSRQVTGGAALRGFWGTTELRLLLLAADRTSQGELRYEEVPLSAQLSIGFPVTENFRLGASYRFIDNLASGDAEGFAFVGQEVSVNAAWRALDRVVVRGGVGFRHNAAAFDEADDFPRASLALAIRLFGGVSLDLAGTGELEISRNPDGTSSMLTVYAGLRAEGGPWRF